MSIHCLFAFGAGIWKCTRENEAWYRCPWRNIHFITYIGLVSSIELLVQINHAVLCYSCYDYVKLSRNQSWVNLFFLSYETWSSTRFLIHAGIKNCESSRESRLTEDCQLSFEQYRNRGFTVFPKTNAPKTSRTPTESSTFSGRLLEPPFIKS